MKLSVIVPVYKVEKYLPRCLDSLLRQGMESGDWEVICVNDGSPDNCGTILVDYQQRHPDIFKVISQENQGLGAARNTGMKVAQGDYVGFVDSDDYVIDNGFSYLCEHFLESKPNVLIYDFRKVVEVQIDQENDATPNGKVIFEGGGADAYNQEWRSSVWTKFYRRAFLLEHNIWFERMLCEDTIFNFHVFRLNPYVVMTNSSIYRYRIDNSESIMSTKEKGKMYVLLDAQLYVLKMMNSYLQEENILMKEGAKKCICGCLRLVYKESYYVHFSMRKWKQYMGEIRKLKVNQFLCEREKGFIGKQLARIMVTASHSYLMYLLVAFLHINVFEKYILPKLH